ncbi:MAG TPA: RsmB/NOP family class I SAM-dependent RNA methyltransferase, partial [Phenylobacterium sp.]|nr:RsmB/NOP family class I SAM-dependent RNA methyltransferase [Phenylobacterium sp.]
IDRALEARLAKPPPEAVKNILRLGAAQAFAMGAPAYAAVAASVDLAAASAATRPFKGLVNAVLRKLTREPPNLADPEALAPSWLFARWRAAYGEDTARAIAAVIATEPATDLSLKAADPTLAGALEAESLAGGSLRTAKRGDVSAWPGFDDGTWWVQDANAAVPARLLDAQPGQTALDLCAAPGGKTLQLAATGASVTALDRSAARLERLKENLERTGLAAEIITADAATWEDPRRFEAVLLDAPCSATGTFRRNPDVLWAAKPGDIAALAGVQARMLDAAAAKVAPGGRLVYCVCSLEPEEGEAQTTGFLARHPEFRIEPALPGEAGAPEASLTPDGALRLLPQHRAGGGDGFYAVRFRRTPQ